jgi:beta-lactamase superfamily II metal-dependent hydrolase
MSTEKALQDWTVKKCKQYDLLPYKLTVVGQRGFPDLMIIKAEKPPFFCELKSPAGTGALSKSQQASIQKLRDHGQTVYVCDSKEKVLGMLRWQGVRLTDKDIATLHEDD